MAYESRDGETYWGEPQSEEERRLVEDCQRAMLYGTPDV